MEIVQAVLGHSSVTTTSEIYPRSKSNTPGPRDRGRQVPSPAQVREHGQDDNAHRAR